MTLDGSVIGEHSGKEVAYILSLFILTVYRSGLLYHWPEDWSVTGPCFVLCRQERFPQ